MASNLERATPPAAAGSLHTTQAPAFVRLANAFVTRLARAGVPTGPNVLLTVRGRKSGEQRTTPVAVVEVEGRRWVQSPFGEVNWVRNLRAAGEATLTVRRRHENVVARELQEGEAVRFYTDVLAPYLRRQRGGTRLARVLRLSDVLTDPVGAARRHPVFELEAAGDRS